MHAPGRNLGCSTVSMATISHWQGIDRTSATQLYAHVETRIADLDLAITLLRMPECESDTAFAWRARVIARQTLQSVSSLLRRLIPTPVRWRTLRVPWKSCARVW
jgi:hypothetical protein